MIKQNESLYSATHAVIPHTLPVISCINVDFPVLHAGAWPAHALVAHLSLWKSPLYLRTPFRIRAIPAHLPRMAPSLFPVLSSPVFDSGYFLFRMYKSRIWHVFLYLLRTAFFRYRENSLPLRRHCLVYNFALIICVCLFIDCMCVCAFFISETTEQTNAN